MRLSAYWTGNFIFDLVKMWFTIGVTLAIFYGFKMDYDSACLTYVVFPFGILPFTYVTSFGW